MFPPGYKPNKYAVLPPDEEPDVFTYQPRAADARAFSGAGTSAVAPPAPATAPVAADSWQTDHVVPVSLNPGTTTTPAASSFGSSLQKMLRGTGTALGKGLSTVGTAAAQNPGAAMAVAQGVAGLISYGTAKKPAPLQAPAAYTPPIRGARGMEYTSKASAQQGILSGQATASQPGSTDTGTNVIQKLLAQGQAGQQLQQLASEDNRQFQADQGREDSQRVGSYDKNYQLQRGFQEGQYNEQTRLYQGRRQQAGAMVQGAVNTVFGTVAQNQQAKDLQQESANRQAEARIMAITNELSATTDAAQRATLLDEMKRLDPSGNVYKLAINKYGVQTQAAGGKIPTGNFTFKESKGGGGSAKASAKVSLGLRQPPVSVQTFHAMSKDFANHLGRFSRQAQQAFDRSIQQAITLRSAGHRAPTLPSSRRG